ncbi:MAG: hypothetical protein AB1468_04470 [Candidatus Micrarchaeota archaeon]
MGFWSEFLPSSFRALIHVDILLLLIMGAILIVKYPEYNYLGVGSIVVGYGMLVSSESVQLMRIVGGSKRPGALGSIGGALYNAVVLLGASEMYLTYGPHESALGFEENFLALLSLCLAVYAFVGLLFILISNVLAGVMLREKE